MFSRNVDPENPHVQMAVCHMIVQLNDCFDRGATIRNVADYLRCSKYLARKILDHLEDTRQVYQDRKIYRPNVSRFYYYLTPVVRREYQAGKFLMMYQWILSYYVEGAIKNNFAPRAKSATMIGNVDE
jgi:hypothetical protein